MKKHIRQSRELKQVNYYLATALVKTTGIIFFFQLLVEVAGITTRKPGYEWVIWACGCAFVVSLLYAVVLMIMNAWWRSQGTLSPVVEIKSIEQRMKRR